MIAGIEFDLPEEHICHIHMHVGVSVGRIHTRFCGASTLVAPNGYGIRYWVFFCGQAGYCGFEIGHRNLANQMGLPIIGLKMRLGTVSRIRLTLIVVSKNNLFVYYMNSEVS